MNAFSFVINNFRNIKECLNTKYVGEPFTGNEPASVLKKPSGRDFVILNITDVHLSDYDYRLLTGIQAVRTIKRLVKDVKPDLITVTGDTVCAKSSRNSIDYFVSVMDSFGVPWAPVFGNHEDEANCDKNFLARRMMSSKTCLMQGGEPEMGVGNYIVKIVNESGNTVETIYMTDSNHGQPNERAAKWLLDNADENTAESVIMMHIPLPDYQYAYEAAFDADNKCRNDSYEAFGEKHERVSCERDKDGNPVDRGFFENAKKLPNLRYIFCGHEHLNNFSILWNGVRLTYTLKVGKGSGFRRRFNGGTVITVGDTGITSVAHRTLKNGKFTNIEYKEINHNV